jgi:hypothetical protein
MGNYTRQLELETLLANIGIDRRLLAYHHAGHAPV